jgi:ABC-type phosphate/phosphonate transport system substrate-binding protein
MAGYVLPRHLLGAHDAERYASVVQSERNLGSYSACFEALLKGEADLTASYANARGIGYMSLCGEDARWLKTLAYTGDCPNDGIVLSPRLGRSEAVQLAADLGRLFSSSSMLSLLPRMFEVTGFDVPPAGTYRSLLPYCAWVLG